MSTGVKAVKFALWWLYRLATIPIAVGIIYGPVFFWVSLGLEWFPKLNNHLILLIISGPVVATYHFGWQWLNPRVEAVEGKMRGWLLERA